VIEAKNRVFQRYLFNYDLQEFGFFRLEVALDGLDHALPTNSICGWPARRVLSLFRYRRVRRKVNHDAALVACWGSIERETPNDTHPMSRGRIVRWMLEEIGHPYRTELLDFGTTMKAPEYLSLNPMGEVPAIRHGDTVATECAAICAYLADAFPQAGLAPRPGDRLRGAYYRWMFFAAGPVEAAVTNFLFCSLDPTMAHIGSGRKISPQLVA
jgi:Glutathione S-transferase, N-terminal domain